MNFKCYELTPIYDQARSFYGKAIIIELNGVTLLKSYDTIVATLQRGVVRLIDSYSRTTFRHQKEFFKQFDTTNRSYEQERDRLKKLIDTTIYDQGDFRLVTTGRDYDFTAYIVNQTDHDIKIIFTGDYDFLEAVELEATNKEYEWRGFTTDQFEYIKEAILTGDYEIENK